MALMPKIKIGDIIYDLKDSYARQTLATLLGTKAAAALGSAAFVDTANTVVKGGTGVPTQNAVAVAIENIVGDFSEVMHFKGIADKRPTETFIQALERKYPDPKYGDLAIVATSKCIYIYDGSEWQILGDESTYLSLEEASSLFLSKSTTLAGLSLESNISKDQLSNTLGINSIAAQAHGHTNKDIIDSISQTDINNWNSKQNTISDLQTIREGAALGATALQDYTETDPTVPSHVKNIAQSDIEGWNQNISDISDLNEQVDIITENISDIEEDISEITTTLAGKQDTLVAGENITIEGNVISSTGGGGGGEDIGLYIENGLIVCEFESDEEGGE